MTLTNAAGAGAALEPERLQRGPRRRDTAVLLAAFAILVVVEAALFVFAYLPSERAQAVATWKARLVALADDREAALATWAKERTADARVVAAYPTVAELVGAGDVALAPGEGAAAAHVAGLLDRVVQSYGYQGAYVLDARGAEVASSTGSPPLCEACLAAARATLGAGATTLDFYLGDDGTPLIAVMAPVATAAPGATRAPAGVVVLTADPRNWVYPMLAAQPVPTSSGEAVLVRREGGRVRFLSPLRYLHVAPLAYSRPLDTPDFAAQEVVGGHEGFFAYSDYRGAPVFAATRLVAGTPWGLVLKVDRSEALAPFDRRARTAAIFLALITAALALAGFGFWRSRRARYEAALARSEARFADLFERANDAVVISRPDGRIVAVNPRAEALYGYPRSELLARAIRDLRAPETLPQLGGQLRQVLDGEGLVFETVHLASDGARIPVEVSSRKIDWDDGPVLFSLVRDIRERRAAEERIRFLNRLLRTISEVNQLVVRERDRDRLLAETCRILVEDGEFHMAWVGLAELASGRVRPVAVAGFDDGYLAVHEVRCDDSPAGRGPTGTAIRERRPVVANNWEADERMAAWRAAGRERGYRASAAVPLATGGAVVGALTVYADRAGMFTEEIVKLLVELAGDLSFALAAIEMEQQKAAAVAALTASETRFRELFGRIGSGVVVYEAVGDGADFVIRGFNPAAERIEKVEAAAVIGRRVTEVFPGVVEFGLFDVLRRVWRSGEAQRHPVAIYRDERMEGWRENQVYRLPSGEVVAVYEDVTERKRAEETSALLVAIVQSSNDAVIAKRLDGTVLSWNTGAERLYGYSAAEVVGQNIAIVVPPELRAELGSVLERVGRGERIAHHETARVRKDGTRVEVSLAVSPILDSAGAIIGASTIARDMTEQRRTEEHVRTLLSAVQQERKRLSALVDSITDEVWFADAQGRFTLVNPAALREFGIDTNDPVAVEALAESLEVRRPDGSLRPVEEAPPLLALAGEVVRNQEEIVRTPLRNELRYRQVSAAPVRDAAGNVIGSVSVVRDVTELKQAELEVRRLNLELEQRVADRTRELADTVSALEREVAERQRAQATAEEYTRRVEDLYNHAPCGYHSLDAEGAFLAVNDTELDWLGYAREEVVGRLKFTDLLTEEGRATFAANFPGFKARGWVADLEFDMVRRDGSLLPVVLSATAVVGEDGGFERSRSTMFDITDLKRARLETARRAAELEAANSELEAFSYSVSHDLRAPLRAIDGFSRIVEEEYGGRLDDEGRRLLRVVRDNTHRMGQLIDDLLAFSRSARHPLQPLPIDMGALARSVWEELTPPEARTRCEFTVGALPVAVGDAAMMRQVWTNLLSNAVKFTRPAERPAIAVSGRTDGREVIYTVSDNGVGFDMTYAGKLFGVFQRLHPGREFEGTGVGLALVQRIVHRHGGRVWADGAVGKGATFSFALPAPGGTS